MVRRTTLLMDEDSQRAARDLAVRLNCSTSEAIRRAIVGYRDVVVGLSRDVRSKRVGSLRKMIELSKDSDPAAEVKRLKSEDLGF
jgi:hypothetical protein